MKEQTAETLLGALVMAVALGFFGFAFSQTREGGASAGTHEYFGLFSQADGIAPGTEVRIAGVKVGVVRSVTLDENFNARVVLAVDQRITLRDSTAASVRMDAFLGGGHLALEPAGLDPLPPGSEIIRTQGSQDLFTMFRSVASSFTGGSDDEETEGATAP
jgi:phospholipid/cholesterol/gamma-HCH transport system substrate-binding protein